MNLSRRKTWAFRVIACSGSTLIALGVIAVFLFHRGQLVIEQESGEVRLQPLPLYVQEPGHERTGHKYLYDPELGWRNIPNWTATTFGRKLTTNSHGLRDRECSYEKPDGWKRILVLGDSFAWGYGVADDEIFSEVMEADFALDGINCEVINSGVSGWGTDQQYLYLASEGLRYQPDVVLVALYLGNDPVNNTQSIQYGLSKPVFGDLDLTLCNVPVPKPPADKNNLVQSAADPHALTARILEEMADLCAGSSAVLVVAKFGVFQIPDSVQATQADAALRENIERILDKLYYLDLDAEFRQHSHGVVELTRGNHDGHWNAFGHRVVARIVRDYLDEHAMLSD